METLSSLVSSLLISAAIAILVLFLAFSIFLLKIYSGKSMNSSLYPPVMGTVYHQLLYLNRLYDKQTDTVRQHPTYRLLDLSTSEVFTADPRNIEHVLKTCFNGYSAGQDTVLRELFGDGFFAVDGEKWHQQRKLASSELSSRVLKDFSCRVFRKNAVKVSGIVSGFVATKRAFDVQDLFAKCALDSIFEAGFGMDLNCLEGMSKEGSEFNRAFDDANALIYRRYSDFLWKIKQLLNVGSEAVLRKDVKVIDDFVYGVISNKREQLSDLGDKNDKEDILSRLLEESKKDPRKITNRYLRDIILSFIIAGKDTTGTTLSWFFYMICKNPLIQDTIVQQVREVINGDDDEDAVDFVGKITDSTLDKMQYLHAALTETLRLYPAIPMDGKCAERDDVLPDGYRVKRGDGVTYLAYAMGRMPYIWGDDAEEFRPERWLRNGLFQPESSFKFVSFHGGPRICLGKEFAYKQMKIVAMVLLRFFRFQMEDEKKQLKYKTMITLHIDGGFHVRAFSRLASTHKKHQE